MASAIQFGGLISGLKTSDIIDALMQAEKLPLQRLQTRESALTGQRTAYDSLRTSLNDLLAKVRAFTTTKSGGARTATSSLTSAFTASASPSATTGQYRVTVDRLATATRATSIASIGTALTQADATADVVADPTNAISALNLPGAVTAGQVSVIVDGKILRVTVDPTKNLASVLDGIATSIQGQVQTTDPAATTTATIVANRVQVAISGGSGTHSIRFGASDDTSNALGILGLSSLVSTNETNATLTGTSALGVVRTSSTLDTAGLTGLGSTTAGKLTINGVDIAYDTTVDSLSTLLGRINASQAGVVATLDRANDRVVLTSTATGARAMSITDTSGTLGAALGLAPGTIDAQVIGQTSQVTVDGRTVVSDTNHVTTAIDGVALDLVGETAVGVTGTLTVGVDRDAIKSAVKDFIKSFNALGDQLDTLTRNDPGTTGGNAGTTGPLTGDWTARSLFLDLRGMIMQPVAGLSGSLTSLGAIGVTTGAFGAAVGSTSRLTLDEAALDKALDTDPTRVATLLDDATGALGPVADKLNSMTAAKGFAQTAADGIDDELRVIREQETDEQNRIDLVQAALEAKYAAMESLLSQLQSTSSSLSSQVSSMSSSGA